MKHIIKIILLFYVLFSSHALYAKDYSKWSKKYPIYQSIFLDNSNLDEKVLTIRENFKRHIQSRHKNYSNKDSEKTEFYNNLLDELEDTVTSTKILGQSLIFAYESNLDPKLKQYHFGEICVNLKIYSPNNTFQYKSDLFIEWGKKFVDSKELKLISDSIDLNYKVTKEVNSICKKILIDIKFFN